MQLDLAIDIAVPCQRCLEPLPLRFEVHRNLVFSDKLGEFEPIEDEDEETDTITDLSLLDVHDLVDQEVVLSLPMSPCHAEDQCPAQPALDRDVVSLSPFSVLSKLTKQ